MNLLFEEDGAFKAGTVLASTDGAYQVELPGGRRSKVKASHVLLHFDDLSPARLLELAQLEAGTIDIDFLWQAAPQQEFGFADLAAEYYGAPSSLQQAALLLRLHSAPVYFYRKGRGRYRPAPADTLKAALAAVERRRLQDELRQSYVSELKQGRAPAVFAEHAIAMLARPDRSTMEVKALEQAADEMHTTPLRLMLATGAIASPYRWHVESFLVQHFPRGVSFSPELPLPSPGDELPLAPVAAFSIDDSATTEIDDAFSVTAIEGGNWRIGIHIAAPALALGREHPLDAIARTRMSTVYAPGNKITMLPPSWVEAYSLTEGGIVPVLSLYVDVDAGSLDVLATESRLERVRVQVNLRHDRLDDVITESTIADTSFSAPFAAELTLLWRFARRLLAEREAARGRPEPLGRVDISFELDGEGEAARVGLKPRTRGAPLDLLVAELMILANRTWGRWLSDQRTAGIYRSQALGRVRMSTTPAAHEAMGVSHYAWSTSPLRRYVDLVNQRQLIACVRNESAPYAGNDADLFAIVSAFDAAYSAYAEFQERMERYWSLRWLQQEGLQRVVASVIRGDVLRLAGLPFVTRLPGLPELPRGQQLELEIVATDLVDLTLGARVHRLLDATDVQLDELEDEPSPADAPAAQGEETSAPGGTTQAREAGNG